MPTHYDDDDDLPASRDRDRDRDGEREISLGTGTVLAIFLALALVCSLFFGLGYSMGRKSVPGALASSSLTSSTPRRSSSDITSPGDTSGATAPDNQVTQPLEPGTASRTTPSAASPSTQVRDHMAAAAKPSPTAALPPAPNVSALPIDPGSQSFVQVAAVSRREDADLLLTALKRRGYSALVRQQPQDKLLHVQVGPFPSKKDAEAMRQRLITDGYNPIIK